MRAQAPWLVEAGRRPAVDSRVTAKNESAGSTFDSFCRDDSRIAGAKRPQPTTAFVFFVSFVFSICISCSRTPTTPTPSGTSGPVTRVLMLTATAGFRHDSIATAREVLTTLGSANGFTVTATEDLSTINSSNLANFDVLMFANTSGELPFTADQQATLLAFVNGGKGFVGTHSATDTLYGWPDYGRLVGAYFNDHPWTQQGRVIVEDAAHPAAGVRDTFPLEEEFYTFRENPRPRVQVLLRLDPASVGASGDLPLAWAQSFGNGRTYYNALGHFPATWRDPRFQSMLVSAIHWTGRR
jgi:type 1 glutamine amidotransferase